LGIDKCQYRARQCIYWPNINNDIKNLVLNREICLKFRNSNIKEPLIPSELTEHPWETVRTDLFQYKNKNYLMVVDYYSKFIEVEPLSRITSQNTIQILKSIFARHGIPKKIRSDNGTQYTSELFQQFCKYWGIQHITSSLLYSQSNGMVERHIQVMKKNLKKAELDDKDINLCLLELRNTPIDQNIKSPAELLMSRKLNGLLPNFDSQVPDMDTINHFKQKQLKQKYFYDKRTVNRNEFKVGDNVRVKLHNKTFEPGKILEVLNNKHHHSM
jgi:transposase InsO family protein